MGGSVALRLKLVMALSCKDGDSVIARLGTSRGNLTKSRDSHGRYRSLGMTYPICHTQ